MSPFIHWPEDATVLVLRGNAIESRHYISYALVDRLGKVLASAGDIEEPVFMRSVAKPLFCAAIAESGAFDHFGFSAADIALAAGSHSGEPMHVRAVERMLRAIGLSPAALACGAHPPLNQRSAEVLARAHKPYTALHNNCSGNHAAVLALAVYRHLGTRGYLSPSHPAEREILAACAGMLGISLAKLRVAVDGCGMPTVAAPLRAIAWLFASVPSPAMRRVADAMTAHPSYVGGTGRFDTGLMRAAYPRIVCKSGAEGVHAVGLLDSGLGLALKVSDGNDRAVAPFVVATLRAAGELRGKSNALLAQFRRPTLFNHTKKEIGTIAVADRTSRLNGEWKARRPNAARSVARVNARRGG